MAIFPETLEPCYETSLGNSLTLESVFDSIEGTRFLVKRGKDVYSISGEIIWYSVSRVPPYGQLPEPEMWARRTSGAAIYEVRNSECLAALYGRARPIFEGEPARHYVFFFETGIKLDIVVRCELSITYLRESL
jgi:hypothetical protein